MPSVRQGWIEDGVGYIPLTKGLVACVDADKLDWLSQLSRWSAHYTKNGWYVRGVVNGKRIYLHRLLLQAKFGQLVDHINHDTLDNRLCNLRLCSKAENSYNAIRGRNNSSGFKGVCWYKPLKKWRAYIGQQYKQVHLGYFNTLEEAVLAYKKAASSLYGEFANA